MRIISSLMIMLFVPALSMANDIEKQINKACLRHAVSLIAQLKNDVVNNLDKQQSDQALKIATESCQAYFKKGFAGADVATVNNETNKKEKSSDSFTDKILSGEVIRKNGNKRLMKRH